MEPIDYLLQDLSEDNITRVISLPHDHARNTYLISGNTVADYRSFEDELLGYIQHHQRSVYGMTLPDYVAREKAKSILEREYNRGHGGEKSAFADAKSGMTGGLSAVMTTISDSLKNEARRQFSHDVYARYVTLDFADRTEIIRQLFRRVGHLLGPAFDLSNPQRYAEDAHRIITTYVDAVTHLSSELRRH